MNEQIYVWWLHEIIWIGFWTLRTTIMGKTQRAKLSISTNCQGSSMGPTPLRVVFSSNSPAVSDKIRTSGMCLPRRAWLRVGCSSWDLPLRWLGSSFQPSNRPYNQLDCASLVPQETWPWLFAGPKLHCLRSLTRHKASANARPCPTAAQLTQGPGSLTPSWKSELPQIQWKSFLLFVVTEHCETPAMGALDSSQGFDWSSELGDLELVKPGSINSHYASLSFKTIGLGAVIAVISLARVSPPGAARWRRWYIGYYYLFEPFRLVIFITFFAARCSKVKLNSEHNFAMVLEPCPTSQNICNTPGSRTSPCVGWSLWKGTSHRPLGAFRTCYRQQGAGLHSILDKRPCEFSLRQRLFMWIQITDGELARTICFALSRSLTTFRTETATYFLAPFLRSGMRPCCVNVLFRLVSLHKI